MTAPHRYPPQAPPAAHVPYGQAPRQHGAHQQAPYRQVPYQQASYQQASYQQAPRQQAPEQQVPHHQAPYQQAPYQQAPWRPGPWPQQPRWTPPAARPAIRQPWVIALIVLAAVTVLAALVLAAAGGGPAGGGVAGGKDEPAGRCPGGSLEGCYTEEQMPAFLEQAVTFVQGFSDDRYQGMPHPAGYQLIPDGRSAQSPCGALDAMTYAYCPGDDRVYIGQRQLWQFYSGIGDAAAVVGLAHEYGHHIQTVAGVPDDRSPAAQVTHENQADCIAGAFVGWAQEKGYLEDGDTRDIAGLVRAIASSEDDPGRDHGTLAEREASLSTGIRDGLPGCSAFYPRTPVHQGH